MALPELFLFELYGVCFRVCSVHSLEFLTLVILLVVLMHFKSIVLSDFDNTAANVSAVVRHTLKVGEYI